MHQREAYFHIGGEFSGLESLSMPQLNLIVISLRYSPWSMRAWLALQHAGAQFKTTTIALPHMTRRADEPEQPLSLAERRKLGSVTGSFPVLHVDGVPIHEALAI